MLNKKYNETIFLLSISFISNHFKSQQRWERKIDVTETQRQAPSTGAEFGVSAKKKTINCQNEPSKHCLIFFSINQQLIKRNTGEYIFQEHSITLKLSIKKIGRENIFSG